MSDLTTDQYIRELRGQMKAVLTSASDLVHACTAHPADGMGRKWCIVPLVEMERLTAIVNEYERMI